MRCQSQKGGNRIRYSLLIFISKSIIFRSLKKTRVNLRKCQRFKFCELLFIFWRSWFLYSTVAGLSSPWLCLKSVFLLENISFGRLWKVYKLLHVLTRLWKSLATVISKWRKVLPIIWKDRNWNLIRWDGSPSWSIHTAIPLSVASPVSWVEHPGVSGHLSLTGKASCHCCPAEAPSQKPSALGGSAPA